MQQAIRFQDFVPSFVLLYVKTLQLHYILPQVRCKNIFKFTWIGKKIKKLINLIWIDSGQFQVRIQKKFRGMGFEFFIWTGK